MMIPAPLSNKRRVFGLGAHFVLPQAPEHQRLAMIGHRCFGFVAFLMVLSVVTEARGQPWLQGTRFRRQLETPLGVTWKSNPLRSALRNLSQNQQVAILLDRRIDPGRRIDIAAQDVTLRSLLQTLAEQNRLGLSVVDSVVYLGPPETATKLATVAALRRADLDQLPPAVREPLRQRAAMAWDDLATPGELVASLARQAGVEVTNLDRIPHDLWPQYSLPPLPWTDRLTLVLAGFDATFRWMPDGRQLELVAIPDKVSYHGTASNRNASTNVLEQLAQRFPHARVRNTDSGVLVEGSFEDFDTISQLLSGQSVADRPPAEGEKRYSLTVSNRPVGPLVQQLARQLNLQLKFDADVSPEQQQQLVSFKVQEATLEQLLQAALEPAGLKFQRDGTTIMVQLGSDSP